MIYYEKGSTEESLSADDLKEGMFAALKNIGEKHKVLVIPLRPVEGVQRLQGGDNGGGVDAGLIQLLDVSRRRRPFIPVGVEDRGAVLPARVRPLAVQRGGIMGVEEHLQELPVGDLLRISWSWHSLRPLSGA